jgi:hypothetical protein
VVRHLPAPVRPLRGGNHWTWHPQERWLRIYHRDDLTPSADTRRLFGPLLRFDHHTPPFDAPAPCPAGRTVVYAAKTLRTCGGEVFGDGDEATVCPHFRAAVIRPARSVVVQDVQANGSMLIGALPALGTADVPRTETQAWARAVYEDRPASPLVAGIRYTSAHDEGASVALWDTSPQFVVVQDVPISDPAVFRLFATAMREIEMEVSVVPADACVRCRDAVGRGHPC